jgi:hypothetical protein
MHTDMLGIEVFEVSIYYTFFATDYNPAYTLILPIIACLVLSVI